MKGSAALCVHDECPGAEITLMGLEYGTVSFEAVLHALRGAHWLEIHRDAPAEAHGEARDAKRRHRATARRRRHSSLAITSTNETKNINEPTTNSCADR